MKVIDRVLSLDRQISQKFDTGYIKKMILKSAKRTEQNDIQK